MSLISPALAGSLLLVPPGKPLGNRERLYSQAGVCDKDQGSNSRAFFFLLQGFKRVGWGMASGRFKCITFIAHFICVIITSAPPQIGSPTLDP